MSDEGLWADDDDDGAFSSEESIFGDEGSVDTDNRLLTRSEDARLHSPPVAVKPGGIVEQPVALVAVFDERGEPLVARHRMEKGKPVQLEEFRRPTPDEYNSVMFNGQIVRGGVVAENVPVTTNLQPNLMRTPLGQTQTGTDWKKIGMFTIGGLALVGGSYYAYRWYQNREG